MRYSIEPKDRQYFEGYRFLSFAEKIRISMSQILNRSNEQ